MTTQRALWIGAGVGFVLVLAPPVHPGLGIVGGGATFALSMLVSTLMSVVSSAAIAGSTSTTSETQTRETISLAQAFERMESELEEQSQQEVSPEEIREAYVNGEINELELENLLERHIADDVGVTIEAEARDGEPGPVVTQSTMHELKKRHER